MKTMKIKKCSFCEKQLNVEEVENPREDDDGDQICDQCYHDQYEFTCCGCLEYDDVKHQHNLLVVFEASSGAIPGVYQVTDMPYFTSAMIGEGWLHSSALKRIADVNPGMNGNGYPCGHLCLECQGRVLAQFADRCRVCLKKSASCLRIELGSWKNVEARDYQWAAPKIVCAECRHSHRGAWRIATAQMKENANGHETPARP